jgi:hypothetical protein
VLSAFSRRAEFTFGPIPPLQLAQLQNNRDQSHESVDLSLR